jgi:hypothetical protein
VTPQCGERKSHQVILEGIAAINKEYINKRNRRWEKKLNNNQILI